MCCHPRRTAQHAEMGRDGQGDEVTIPKEHFVISLLRGSVFCLKPLQIMRNLTSWSPVGSLMV